MTNDVRLMNVGLDQVPEIAHLHVKAFSDRALAALGTDTVRRYYESQIDGAAGVNVIGAYENDRLLGFCVCGLTGNPTSKFMARHKNYVAYRLLSRPWLLFHTAVRQQVTRTLLRSHTSATKAANEPVFRVLAIGVSPDAQGRGIGSALMTAAEQAAAEQGYAEMGLSVHPENAKALRLYEKLGWQRMAHDADWTGSMVKRLS